GAHERDGRVLRRGLAAPGREPAARRGKARRRQAAGRDGGSHERPGPGFRQPAFRPGRSVLAIALVAFASFVIVSVGAFRHDGPSDTGRRSESGGFTLLARSVLP